MAVTRVKSYWHRFLCNRLKHYLLRMKTYLLLILTSFLFFTSCIVQSPKYSTLDKVMTLKLGMSKSEVEEILNLKPYNLHALTDTSTTFIYVYRVKDRKTLYLNTRPTNGRESLGKYTQLAVTYSKKDKVTGIGSCIDCPDNLENVTKVDVEKIVLFLTATLPAILIYLGFQSK